MEIREKDLEYIISCIDSWKDDYEYEDNMDVVRTLNTIKKNLEKLLKYGTLKPVNNE